MSTNTLQYVEIQKDPLILDDIPKSFKEGFTYSAPNTMTASQIYTDVSSALIALRQYNSDYADLSNENNRYYSFTADHTGSNPVNDPTSHEYIPRINEAALDDIQQRLDFQNRVYAYTSIGLITVIVAGILINSNR